MSGLPYLKFFPTDWQSDEGVALLSLAARGLWFEMLCIMHKADGYLRINGRGLTTVTLSRAVRSDPVECETLLAEIEDAGVFSRDDDGTIFSRRMVRDITKFERDKSNGARGGNPHLKRTGTGNGPEKPPVKQRSKRGVNPDANPPSRERARSRVQSPEENLLHRFSEDSDPSGRKVASPPVPGGDFSDDRKGTLPELLSEVEETCASGQARRIKAHVEEIRTQGRSPRAYLAKCLDRPRPQRIPEPPEKPPDSVVVPSRFVRQGSDEWQRLKAERGEPIATMHHGDAGTWVRSA